MEILLMLTALMTAGAEELDVNNIVINANDFLYGQSTSVMMTVELSTSKKGDKRTRERQFSALRLNLPEDERRFYLYFQQPAEVEGTVLVTWNHANTTVDRWLYLPALDRVNRLSTKDERTSFVGSAFYYEDMTGRNPSVDNHQLMEETDDYYVVQSTPKNPATVEFDFYQTWITKQGYVPVEIKYTRAGKEYRTLRIDRLETIGGRQTAVRIIATEDSLTTTLTYNQVKYDQDLTEEMFSERYFKAPPSVIRENN